MQERYDQQQTNPLLAAGDAPEDQTIQKGCSSSSSASSTDKFWSFCHACADTTVEESVIEPEVYRRKLAVTAVETAVEVYLVYLWDYCVHDKFCDFIFHCGCTYIWDGGWDDCNVHNTTGAPKCPWCTATAATAWTTTYMVQAVMLGVFLYLLSRRNSQWYAVTRCCLQREGQPSMCSEVTKDSEKPEAGVAIKFVNEVDAPVHRSNLPWVDRLVRMLLVPALAYFLVGTIVAFIFFVLNPHYYIFIFE